MAADAAAGLAALPEVSVAAHVVFGLNGNAAALQRDGWSYAESGFTWSTGAGSSICIPYRPGNGELMLELTLNPLVAPPVVPRQRLSVAVNGIVLGNETISGEGTLGYEVPKEALDGTGQLVVSLSHPDAFAPATLSPGGDTRVLGFALHDVLLLWVPPEPPCAYQRRPPLPVTEAGSLEAAVRFCTALSVPDLMHNFESLGHNCEFGLMQRAAGAEPLGLLRFAGISMQHLLTGIDQAFEGIDDPAQLGVFTERARRGEEFIVHSRRYRINIHSTQNAGETTPEAVLAKFAPHLAYLRRQFQDVLETGSRIFVLQRPGTRTQSQVLPLLTMLRSQGPNILLYVTADRSVPTGTVVQERADLFHGYIDKFAELDRGDEPNLAAWISICANTYRMWRESGRGG
jgi:hypothetical protein